MPHRLKPAELLIGAHMSIAGGVHNALLLGQEIGATTIQIFTANQRQWHTRTIAKEEVALWHATLKDTGLKEIMSHDSYLINLGAPNPENLEKSRLAFRTEIERCLQLKLSYLNFHPGAALDDSPEACLDRIIESLLNFESLVADSDLTLLVECTAGQGSSVGHKFEQLAYIVQGVKKHLPIGVCIDTCHAFAAGYDIRTSKALDITLDEFDRIVGLKYLRAFHVNDSMKGLGSHIDRHAPLGKGELGLECFKALMQNPRTREIPKYLETPEPDHWPDEIALLREFASKKH